jgi:hypothetical protein
LAAAHEEKENERERERKAHLNFFFAASTEARGARSVGWQ